MFCAALYEAWNVRVAVGLFVTGLLPCSHEADISGEANPAFGHANANFAVFIDRIRNQFLKK